MARSGEQDRLGWWPAGWLALSVVLLSSVSAWSLDLKHEIQKSDEEAARILRSLGRDRKTGATGAADKTLRVELIPASKAKRR